MRWSDRQAALLAEMGIRLWPAPADPAAAAPAAAAAIAASAPAPLAPVERTVIDDGGSPAAFALAEADVARGEASTGAATLYAATGRADAGEGSNVTPRRPPTLPLPIAPRTGSQTDSRTPPQAQPLIAPLPAPPTAPLFGSATAADVHSLDWPALREAVAGCTACTLCRSRTQTVFGVGHPRAHWMVVGEAPGEQEDREGEPFVGRSGQLLDNMLRAIGLSRRVEAAAAVPARGRAAQATPDEAPADPAHCVYIANTLKCRPPGNRNPAPDELARCEGYLIRQIELVRPRIILAMGRFAVQSLLRSSEPIGRLRGRVHRYQGVPLVVTYHPAYLLRNLPEKARAWDDLCLAMDALQMPAEPGPAPPADG